MKSFARLAGFSLALVVAGFGSGCATSTPTAKYQPPAQDFEVVESSTERPLTDIEKAEVRASVASYLDREGVSDSGDYFLKVYLTPENMDAESEWVVVRFTRYTAQRVAMVSSYPYDNFMYSSYYPYYAYDVYPYGYGCVARISFQYYVDPFYNRRYYYYPRRGHGGHKGDHHDTAHNHGGKPHNPDHNSGPRNPSGPPRAPHSGSVAGRPVDADARPPSSQNRYDRNRPNRGSNPNSSPAPTPPSPTVQQDPVPVADAGPRPENPGRNWRGRPEVDTNSMGVANTDGGTRSPRPERVSDPNRRPQGNRPVNSTTASTQGPVTRQPQQWRNNPTDSGRAPSRVNNPTRTEAYVAPGGNRPASNANRPAPTQRPAPTPNRPSPGYSRPAPAVQPTRAPAPSHQQQPARSAPASASRGDGGESRRTDNAQREAMR